MATSKLADWIEHLSFDSLPDAVRIAAVKSFTNYVGCAIGGYDHEATSIAIRSSANLSPPDGFCSILGSSDVKLYPSQAALVNGVASHVHDYDDTHLSTIIHPTAAVASSLVAYAQLSSKQSDRNLSGPDFVCSLVAGIEAECILGLSVWPSHYDVGWHITATVGSVGAAIAIGKAMKLSKEQLIYAIGIASDQVAGMRRHFGSHSKALGIGLAAQSGLQAAVMAQNGMTAAVDALEGKRGWIECVCPEQDAAKKSLDELIEGLVSGKGVDGDGKWEIEKNSFKPFPCGIVIHPIIDGCSQLREDGVKEDAVETIELRVHPLVLELTGKKSPKDGLEAKFSVYHGAACGIIFGKATPAEYTDQIVVQTADLRKKISAIADQKIRPDECDISVQTTQGQVQKHVEHAVGSLATPMTEDQLHQKFLEQVTPVYGSERAERLLESLGHVDSIISQLS